MSSVTPIICKNGSPMLALGGAGYNLRPRERIITSVFQVISNIIDRKMSVADSLAESCIHNRRAERGERSEAQDHEEGVTTLSSGRVWIFTLEAPRLCKSVRRVILSLEPPIPGAREKRSDVNTKSLQILPHTKLKTPIQVVPNDCSLVDTKPRKDV